MIYLRLSMSFIFITVFSLICLDTLSGDPVEYVGSITGRGGSLVHIKLDKGSPLTKGQSTDLYKYFEKTIFNMKTTGWLHIAHGKIVTASGTSVEFRIIEEKSIMTVNNKKVNHFLKGNRVKIIPKS